MPKSSMPSSRVLVSALSQVAEDNFSLYLHIAESKERKQARCCVSSPKSTNPTHEGPTLMT